MARYDVIEKRWEAAGFDIQVVKIPENVINDKLAILSDGSGRLTWTKYTAFLIDTCVLNTNKIRQFLTSFTESSTSVDQNVAILDDLKKVILEVNPLLNPELLIINSENRIKVPAQTDTPDTTRLLVDNPAWNQTGFDFGLEDDSPFDEPIIPFVPKSVSYSPDQLVPYEWDRLDVPLLVVSFSPSDVVNIFKKRYKFPSKDIYMRYIVTQCIHDSDSLFYLLDHMRYTEKYGVELLSKELYGIAIEINPFLDWDEIDLDKVRRDVEKANNKNRKHKHSKYSKTKRRAAGKRDGSKGERVAYSELSEVPVDEILSLSDRLRRQVIGQDEAIERVCESVRLAHTGLKRPDVPIGVFMFSGRSGVGKTHLAKVLAEELCHNPEALVRLDGAEYSQRHEVSKILGAPPGYVGHDNTSPFLKLVGDTPFNVILIDEIDKAHSRLYDVFLSVFDAGRLTDNKGDIITFGNSIIIMTANIGVKEVDAIGKRIGLGDVAKLTQEKTEKAVKEALKKKFRPEFLNRIDAHIVFNSLTTEVCHRIIDLAFQELSGFLAERNITIKYTDAVRNYIAKVGFDPDYGARPLNRAMKKEIYLPLSDQLLSGGHSSDVDVSVSMKGDKVTFKFNSAKTAAKKTTRKKKTSGAKNKNAYNK